MVVNEDQATFIDYFVVTGYDPEIGLVVDNLGEGTSSDNSLIPADAFRPPLQRSFLAKITEYYPKKRHNCSFSPEILHLCMPKGLRFYTEKCVPQKVETHTFANIREDGSRVNGTAITFYEEVRDMGICEAMASLQQEHVRQQMAAERQQQRSRDHVPPGTVSGGTHTLPRGKKHSVNKRVSYYESGGHATLYMSKTICLITRLPVVGATVSILEALHRAITSCQPLPLPLESYIYWMLNEVPLPSPNATLNVKFLDQVVVVQRPSEKELPFFDYPFKQLFDIISVDKFVRIFTAFLLEHQILICSKELSRLMLVCESLCALAFPFRWQLTYVPILPSAQLKFIEAPVPYVMGFCYEDAVHEYLFQSNMCVLDVDTGRAEIPEDLPFFPQHKTLVGEMRAAIERCIGSEKCDGGGRVRDGEEQRSVRLSRSFGHMDGEMERMSLSAAHVEAVFDSSSPLAKVSEIARRVGVKVDVASMKQELSECTSCIESSASRQYFQDARVNNAVRECVAERMALLFFSYEQFLIPCDRGDEEKRESLVAFDKAAFLSDQADSHLPFLAAFLESQMFASFIDAKLLSAVSPDENVHLFDCRLSALRDSKGEEFMGVPRSPGYTHSQFAVSSEMQVGSREKRADYVVPPPHWLAGTAPPTPGQWPPLNSAVLEGSQHLSSVPSPWKQRYPRLRPATNESTARPLSTYGGAGIADSPAKIEQQNQKFVEQLLRDTKVRTKRLLLEKMGKEAVQLGHVEAGVSGVEENTMVAALCHLLERIFAHGLVCKQGKSALWNFVLNHEDGEKLTASSRSTSTSYLAPGLPPPRPLMRRTSSNCGVPSLPRSPRPPVPPPPVPPPRESRETVAALLAGMQGEGEAPAWSRSLLRAANLLADRLATGLEESGGAVLASALGRLNEPRPAMKKSNSVSDFASPSWSLEGEGEKGRGEREKGRKEREETHREASVDRSRRRSHSRPRSPDSHALLPSLPHSISYDLKNVLRMNEMKTELGYARAFVRLALERKLLHAHLASLLSNSHLLSQHYKPYAFVRCEEEREQFLLHILSLNAAQFRCFTNTFTKTKMEYQVVLVSGSVWRGRLPPLWLIVEGAACSTPRINLSHASPFFKFDHRNLGVLSTLRIGHGSSEKPPKWFLDYVLVRNEITGQKYRFPCGRWFGRGVDDGSLERLLVAEPVNDEESGETTAIPSSPAIRRGRRANSRCNTPHRERSPSTGRVPMPNSSRVTAGEVEEMVGEAVNALVRHLHADNGRQSRAEFAHLLCGEGGLVQAIEAAFQCGQNDSWTARLFGSLYPWDYVEKVSVWMHELSRRPDWRKMGAQQQQLIRHSLALVRRISQSAQLGKEGKFHVFVLLSLRDHTLCAFMQLMAWTPMTSQMYDESSLLRNRELLSRFSKLLDSLNEFTFNIDTSLTYGIV